MFAWVLAVALAADPPSDPRALLPPDCPTVGWSMWWQTVDLGLAPTGDDLTVPWDDVASATDALLREAFPDGRGVLVLGESHRKAGTHSYVKALMRASEVVDCVLLEHPAWHQHWVHAFVAGADCEDSWGIAEQTAFGLDEPLCRRDLRYRMLKVASRTATAVYGLDSCYSCPPFRDIVRDASSVVNDLPADLFAEVVLEDRNTFMAETAAAIYAEGRCGISVVLSGRAHVKVPEGFVLQPVRTLPDELERLGLPTLAWPVFDVLEEIVGERNPRPTHARFSRQDDEIVAVYVETL